MKRLPLAVLLFSLHAAPATAQEARPSEGDIFGAPSDVAETPPPAPVAPTPASADPAVEAGESSASSTSAIRPNADPLAIGGQLYLRSIANVREGDVFDTMRLSAPLLVDAYLDARPNDRVRGLVLARMFYDPTFDANAPRLFGSETRITRAQVDAATAAAVSTYGLRASDPRLAALDALLSGSFVANPRIALDQLWLRFDIAHTVFVTAGKQHVKWGTARFWNPTDFLHPVRRDPLAVFDERTGVTMLKLHVPWEARGWNFYGLGLVDLDGPQDTVARLGLAGRAEVVVGTAEFGVDAVTRRGERSKVGADFSAGVGPIDVYGEAAVTVGGATDGWRGVAEPDPAAGPAGAVESYSMTGLRPTATVGGTWSVKYSDEDSLTLGVEYFVNPNGVSEAALYLPLMLRGAYAPFYAARHYAGAYLLLPRPGSFNNTTLFVSTLANLSDRSLMTRLDYQVVVLTYLRVEAYAGVHYGRHGELRFAFDYAPDAFLLNLLDVSPALTLHSPAPLVDLGVALNMSF